MIEDKTIIAPATTSGRGGISVIRMSGPRSEVIAQKMCGQLADPWRFKRCEIKSGENLDLTFVFKDSKDNKITKVFKFVVK